MNSKINNKLTEEQRSFIKLLYKYENKQPEEIRLHPSLKREDGTLPLLYTIKYWVRF